MTPIFDPAIKLVPLCRNIRLDRHLIEAIIPLTLCYYCLCVLHPHRRDGERRGSSNHSTTRQTHRCAICGLREAAFAAKELGLERDAVAYAAEAAELKGALEAFIERTPAYLVGAHHQQPCVALSGLGGQPAGHRARLWRLVGRASGHWQRRLPA